MSDENENYEDDAERRPNAGLQADLIKSYLAFGWRAVRERWILASSLFLTGLIVSVVVSVYFPRTYQSKTILMAVGNPVLDGASGGNPLAGAASLIMRHENLENLVRETGLVEKASSRRAPILKLKDKVFGALFGKPDNATQIAILVGTLETKLDIGVDSDGNLDIIADWGDPQTAAELAEAAREGFIRTRHGAEVSAFEAKMSILDEHATKLRAEVENLADQINSAHQEREEAADKATVSAAPAARPVARSRAVATAAPSDMGEAGLPELKEKLTDMKRKLADLDADRDRRLRDEQAKLAELKLHLTPQHPQVVTEQERIALLTQVPSDVVLLRSEVADLEGNIKQREALSARPAAGGGGSASAGSGSPALPSEIVRALENDKTDPALAAQLSGAVIRYGQLRDDIRSGRMELDTAQAAFNHRYQVMVPAEAPSKPTKPKPGVILGAGFVLSLLVSLILPVLYRLQRGIMIERWQVYQIELPVLAELKLPPHSPD